jgi:hypothetical protein
LDKTSTFEAKAHGNAGIALRRSSCKLAGPGASVSGRQNKGLFWAARYYHSPIFDISFAFSLALQNILFTFSILL